MSKQLEPNNGGSAFPWQVVVNPGSTSPFSGRTMPKDQMELNVQVGLSKRDIFAMAAMQGMYANSSDAWFKACGKSADDNGETTTEQTYARFAVAAADALLERLNAQKT